MITCNEEVTWGNVYGVYLWLFGKRVVYYLWVPFGPHMRQRAKFGANRSNHCGDMAIFRFFKTAAVRHLGVSKDRNFNQWRRQQFETGAQIPARSRKKFLMCPPLFSSALHFRGHYARHCRHKDLQSNCATMCAV